MAQDLFLQPARVFTTSHIQHDPLDFVPGTVAGDQNTICVSGTATRTAEPDVCHVQMVLESKPKDSTQEARESVVRREHYVKQVLTNFSCRSNDIQVTHMLEPLVAEVRHSKSSDKSQKKHTEPQYIFKSEFWVKLRSRDDPNSSLLSRCCDIRNTLIEKLGSDFVKFDSAPSFSHSNELLQKTRTEVSSAAVMSAKQKAFEAVKSLSLQTRWHVKLANHGLPMSVKEQKFTEVQVKDSYSNSAESGSRYSWSEMMRRSCVEVQAEFVCRFQLKVTSTAKRV